ARIAGSPPLPCRAGGGGPPAASDSIPPAPGERCAPLSASHECTIVAIRREDSCMHRFAALFLPLWLMVTGGCTLPRPPTCPQSAPTPATLAFFGLRPDMTVVEVWPGSGRHTVQIAAAMSEQGHLYAATLDPAAGDYAQAAVNSFRERLAQQPLRPQLTLTRL